VPGRRVWQESVGAEGPGETPCRPGSRKEALKGEAQERGELKRVPEGGRADTVKRVAKP
jgi:hypothetical protein